MATHRPVVVLADRAAATFASWLRDHPEVRIVCRDRAGSFRDGAQAGAPQAQQVADAWHLLTNPAQAVERVVGRHHTSLRQPVTTHGNPTGVNINPRRPRAHRGWTSTAGHGLSSPAPATTTNAETAFLQLHATSSSAAARPTASHAPQASMNYMPGAAFTRDEAALPW
ncbi:transposase [Streptomyces virginiae]|uniref:transposase n=1 Tax=Streptomyces virginiae TaxID=1961 RepID=UPI003D809358